jgi:hypothetical protein
MWAVVAWGAAIAVFGLSQRAFWLALGLLAVAGAADVVSAVFRNTILQSTVPDSLRGRVTAVHIMVVTSGPRLGDVEAGTVAALTSVQFSVVSGGLACMAGVGLLALIVPSFARYTPETEPADEGAAPEGAATSPPDGPGTPGAGRTDTGPTRRTRGRP